MIPSFFHTLESPGVKVYKERQKKEVEELNKKTEDLKIDSKNGIH